VRLNKLIKEKTDKNNAVWTFLYWTEDLEGRTMLAIKIVLLFLAIAGEDFTCALKEKEQLHYHVNICIDQSNKSARKR
jgi:hypothetical protein